MDFIEDEQRRTYLDRLQDLEKKVNPKPYTEIERRRILEEMRKVRNRKIFGVQ